jgi:hypothetical protein
VNTQAAQSSANDATKKLIEAREVAALAVRNGARLRDAIDEISARGGSTEAAVVIPALQELRLEASRLFPD